MVLKLYSGTPGSGKSLDVARKIYHALRYGRPVIANFDINTSLIPKCCGTFISIDSYDLNPTVLRNYADVLFSKTKFKEDYILLVIDEAQILFNSRAWNSKGRDDWIRFFSNHRKYGYEIVLIAQFDKMLDRQIRSLLEYEYIHRKVSNFGTKGKIMSLCAGGNLFVCVKFWYPIKEKTDSEFFKAKKKYYQIYDTYNRFDK